jgi:hypothetical protein
MKITVETVVKADPGTVWRLDAGSVNSAELQRQGWQAILESFARHAQTKS